MHLVEATNLPRHVGIIMDGNGRWAESRGEPREAGHKAGSAAVRRIVRVARRLGIEALTLYAFSEQNWSRPAGEVDALMGLLREFLVSERGEILDNDIRLVAIGDLSRLPEHVRQVLDPLRGASAGNSKMTLALALSYGGREEIAAAARQLAREVVAGKLDVDAIDADLLGARLPSLGVGDPDLILRTGGEFRLSNFLLYGAAYAELAFCDRLWPDFTEDDLFAAIASYQRRERRFGLVGSSPARVAVHDGGDPHTPAEGSNHGGDPHTPAEGSNDGGDPHTPAEGSNHGGDPRTRAEGSSHAASNGGHPRATPGQSPGFTSLLR